MDADRAFNGYVTLEMVLQPARRGTGTNKVVVVDDSSGATSPWSLLAPLLLALTGMLRRRPLFT